MEHPIIVMIDTENRVVNLYGKYTRTIPFSLAFTIPSLINGEEVLYVWGVERAMGEDVINVLTTLIDNTDYPPEPLYIRSKQEGYVRIPELKITFSGPKDAKPIEKYGWDLLDKSLTLRKLFVDDKVEILTESQAKALRKNRLDPKAKDKALNDLILNKSVADVLDKNDMFGPDGGEGDEIDGDMEILSEAESILKKHADWGKK